MAYLAHRQASPSDGAPSSYEAYYTNDGASRRRVYTSSSTCSLVIVDIATLHAVVVYAQELLDAAPEPKPLPASALFRAYDVVLPEYGVDPDDDHHISAFVFRIGGERGDGTLIEKFQAILSRMGIVLEFGENTTASSRISPSISAALSSSQRSQQSQISHNRQSSDDSNQSREDALSSSSPARSSSPAQPVSGDDETQSAEYEHEDAEARLAASRAALISAMSNWRNVAAKRHDHQTRLPEPAVSVIEEATEPASADLSQDGQVEKKQSLENHSQSVKSDIENDPRQQQELPSRPPLFTAAIDRWRNTLSNLGQVPNNESSDNTSSEAFSDDHRPTQPQHVVEAQPEAGPQLKVEPQSEAETQPEVQFKAQSEMQHEVQPQNQHETKPELQLKAQHEAYLEEKSEPDTEAKSEPGAVLQDRQHPPPVADVVPSAPSVPQETAISPAVQAIQQQQQQPQQTQPQPDKDDHKNPEQNDTERQYGPKTPNALQMQDDAAFQENYDRLMKRAARARELYLASKFFNHWADRTARRLERDAVARRHMIRYRCFRGWCQAPATRVPPADQMRASVSIKKWQRNVETQHATLEAASKAVAQKFQLSKIHRALNQWQCHRATNNARDTIALRFRRKAIASWALQASQSSALVGTAQYKADSRRNASALNAWLGHTQVDGVKSAVAVQIGVVQQSLCHLREWWDQAETIRRGRSYQHHILMSRVLSAFHQWNLQARAQAFTWRREYLTVTRVFQKWNEGAQDEQALRQTGLQLQIRHLKSRGLRALQRQGENETDLCRLGNRASLFLGATHLLNVFDSAVKRRNYREKEQVKRYLMARYTEMSSIRKKRSFFNALDHWRTSTTKELDHASTAVERSHLYKSQLCGRVASLWAGKAAEIEITHQAAWLHHRRGWLEAWGNNARQAEQREADAWQLWASDKQRFGVREWYKTSLQHSGHAHTASKVREMHGRERRNRCFQFWRFNYEKTSGESLPGIQPALGLAASQGSYRGSWKVMSGRRSTVRRNDDSDFNGDPIQTPTRWTGKPLVITGFTSTQVMDPVREADEDDVGSSSSAGDAENIMSPGGLRGRNMMLALSTTTPRAPVPSYLERELRPRDSEHRSAVTRKETATPLERVASRPGGSSGLFGRTTKPVPDSASMYHDDPLRRPPTHGSVSAKITTPSSTFVSSSRPAVSRSLGAQPSMARVPPAKTPKHTLAMRSVRIRSPEFPPNTPRSPTVAPPAKSWRNAARPESYG